ncbi:MAG: hypothetical protein KAT26_07080 [Marinosulfonomonas sp.]|nr:hypothetical protein [Marinosulfonomonas sp.]
MDQGIVFVVKAADVKHQRLAAKTIQDKLELLQATKLCALHNGQATSSAKPAGRRLAKT